MRPQILVKDLKIFIKYLSLESKFEAFDIDIIIYIMTSY